MSESIQAVYERRRAALTVEFADNSARSRRLTQMLLAAAVALVYLLYRSDLVWWALAPGVAIVILLPITLRIRQAMRRATRLLSLYEVSIGRVDGTRMQSGHTGEAFREDGHLYDRDLNILGADSIFGMLATTRTAVGQRALARLLLTGADAGLVAERQAAVRELTPMLDLRERVALMGVSAFDELPAENFDHWLNQESGDLAMWMRWVLIALSVTLVGLIAAAYLRGWGAESLVRNIALLLAMQAAFAVWLRPRVKPQLEVSVRLAGQTAILREGLSLLKEQKFESEMLRRLQSAAAGEKRALKSLSRSLMLVEQRSKEWFFALALLLALGTHAAVSLDIWKRKHGDDMRRWLAAWSEFEAMLALATYAAEHEENVYPEILESGAASFAAEGLAHPLLPDSVAVKNDVKLDAETRFLLISGSNMAGKSTLLRAVGCNVVLALVGAPVCARSMTLSALRVGASLALVDSLAEGKSKFLAEVERLRDLVALASEGPRPRAQGPEGKSPGGGCLFLIDEIFSGTNSADRRAAAEAVLRGLIREGAIGALSTHDLALAELADIDSLHGVNVHMASPDEADPLGFDYLLKPGVNRTTNALAIVKMLGLAE